MKIIDETAEEFLDELKQGQIIRYKGMFLIITDLTNERGDRMELVELKTGETTSFKEDDLIDSINSPDTTTLLVTESELKILKYFK